MAITQLPTNYVDDVLNTAQNTKRKYRRTSNSDGTYSYTDVTQYTQQGSQYGAGDINAQNEIINQLIRNLTASDEEPFRFTKNSEGEYGYTTIDEYGVETFHPFRKANRVTYTFSMGGQWAGYVASPNPNPRGITKHLADSISIPVDGHKKIYITQYSVHYGHNTSGSNYIRGNLVGGGQKNLSNGMDISDCDSISLYFYTNMSDPNSYSEVRDCGYNVTIQLE